MVRFYMLCPALYLQTVQFFLSAYRLTETVSKQSLGFTSWFLSDFGGGLTPGGIGKAGGRSEGGSSSQSEES